MERSVPPLSRPIRSGYEKEYPWFQHGRRNCRPLWRQRNGVCVVRQHSGPITNQATILLTLEDIEGLEKQLKDLRENHFLANR